MAKVTIYSTPTCTYCVMAKEFFKSNGVDFEEFDVSAEQDRLDQMVEKSGQMGVPVIIIIKEDGGEEVVVGFDEGKIKGLLGL